MAPLAPWFLCLCIKVATKITDQLAYIKDNEVFKFNRTVSFNDRNVNDTGQV